MYVLLGKIKPHTVANWLYTTQHIEACHLLTQIIPFLYFFCKCKISRCGTVESHKVIRVRLVQDSEADSKKYL